MLKKFNILVVFIFLATLCSAQGVVLEYELIPVTAPCADYKNPELQKKIDVAKQKLDKKTSAVIAYCPKQMDNFMPQSPLSNFMTDLLVKIADDWCNKEDSVDFSLLNFGGIRTFMPAGDVTVGKIYEISPFDNNLVIVDIKGSELKKVFKRFTSKVNAAYSKQVTIQYLGDYPIKILVHGREIEDNRIYRMVTLDFVANGGDKILTDVSFEKVLTTGMLERDILLYYITKMGTDRIPLTAKIDGRAVVLPQP